jgi:hypothetical protein
MGEQVFCFHGEKCKGLASSLKVVLIFDTMESLWVRASITEIELALCSHLAGPFLLQ